MKHLLLISVLLITLVGCKKTTNTRASPPPSTNNNNTTNNTSLTQQEQDLVGYWIMDSMVGYINGIRVHGNNQVYTNTVTCMINFKTDWFHANNGGGFNYMKVVDGHNACVPTDIWWHAPNQGSFYLGGVLYGINQLTTNKLQFDYGPPTSLYKYYFHK